MEALINNQSRLMIQMLLTDSKIAEKVFENINDKEKYKICTVGNNGVVTLGKTSYRWWNQLINCQDKLPFESFALKVWDALVDCSSGLNNKAILNGLSHEIIINSVRKREYNWVTNRLYDCWRHVAQGSGGYQQPADPEGSTAQSQGSTPVVVTKSVPNKIILNIDGMKKTIPIVDSVGDTLHIGVDYGVVGVRRLH